MAAFRLSSRGATRLTLAVALGGTALVALLQPKGMSAPAPAAAAAAMLLPGDTTIIYGPRTFTTPTGSAVNFTERFNMTVVPGKRYFLRLVNGDPSGGHRVTAGQVRFNGWQVISSAELASGATFQKVVTARSTDTVFATVQGTAGAYVTVSVLETADPTFLVFSGHFIRGSGTPVTETRTFAISPTAAPPYYFCLTNGDVNGANRVSAATVLINGQQVFVPANFNQQVSTLTAQVSLQPTNTMSVTLSGKPAGFVDICVTATDVTPPVITITAPPPNFITRDTTVTVSGTIQDETPTTVTINGIAATVTNSGFSKVIPLPLEGNNTIHIVAKDRAGLITDSVRTVIRDRTPPVLTVDAPVDGFVTNQATVVVSGTVQDLTAVTVRVNGTPLPVGQGGAFSGSVSLTEGVNQLTITATDAATNATSVVRSVRLDTHPPVLTITAPVEGLLTNQTSVAVSGSVTDESAVTVTVNGAPLTVGAGGVISGSAALVEDANTLAFVATDAAGNQTPVTRHVTRDTQAPVLTVTAPAEGFLTNQTSVVVSGTATDAHTVTVNVNGTSLPVGQDGAFSGSVALTEGHNTLTVTATDAAGNSSSEVRHVIRDTIAPALVVSAPADGFITNQASIVVSGTVFDSNTVTVTVDGVQLNVGQDGSFSGSVSLPVVHNTLIITATDAAGNAAPTVTRSGISDTQNPIIAVSQPGEGDTIATASVTVVGTVTDSTHVNLTVNGAAVLVGQNGAFTTSVDLVIGANTITLVATDTAANDTTFERHVVRKNPLPPNPELVASVVNRAEATLVQENTSFLYTGASPIQTGVAPGTIAFLRAAVLRGRVLDRQLQPLGGAVVTIKGHPEFGQTLSRDDGGYDLAVNGGGSLVLDFAKGGYLPAQRAVDVAWQDYTTLDDVILIPLDPVVTVVDLTTQDIQVARGSSQADADGARQATVFFEPGTQATLHRADGTTQALTSLDVRATEFTVGEHGDEAMPALLPPSSQYTYAVQVTADAQLTAGPGARITFNQPVPLYVENFLDFPVGTSVPTGAYDPDSAKWFPRPNGVVVRITGTDAQGRALLDINGDGIPDSDSLLVFNGIDPLERVKLAGTYPIDSRLWRVPIIETLPHDLNWPFTLLGGDAPTSRVTGPCGSEGADVVRCSFQVQTAFQNVGIAGSPFRLNYASDRSQGNVADRQLQIQLVGATVPAFLNRVDLEINVAGKQFETSFLPSANLNYTFVWDGKDAYGRTVQQTQPATVRIGYLYPVVYSRPAPVSKSFGLPCTLTAGDCTLDSMPPREEDVRALRRVWETLPTTLGGFDATGAGLGGFTLDVQHAYDPLGGILYSGDGTRRIASTLPEQITRFAGTGDPGFASDPMTNGVPATQSLIGDPAGIAVAPDGSVYFTDRFRNRVRKVDPNGIISLVAGSGGTGAFAGDGGPATAAKLSSPKGLALGPDGSVYIADESNQRIRRVRPDGIITTFAGTGEVGYNGDSIPATTAKLNLGGGFGGGLAVGPDGSVFVADLFNNRIRRIGLDGIITTVAGTGDPCFIPGTPPAAPGQFEATCLDNVPATRAKLRQPRGLAIGSDGTIYFSQNAGGTLRPRIQRVDPQGIIHLVGGKDFGASPVPGLGDGGSAQQAQFFAPWAVGLGPDGSVYVSDELGESGGPGTGFYRVRRIRPDGLITTVVGDGVGGNTGDAGPARRARILRVEGIAFLQDGTMLISDDAKVRRVSPPLPGLAGGQTAIASENGQEIYVFSPAGRLLLTIDANNRDTVFLYSYNAQRQLVSITDRNGRVTTLERDANGRVTGLLTPDGQRTETVVDPATGLTAVTDPYGVSQLYQYSGTLLTGATTPQGGTTQYSYDPLGQVAGSISPTGDASQFTSIPNGVSFQSAFGATAQLTAVGSPGGGFSQSLVMPNGQVLQTTVDAEGRRVTLAADGTRTTESEQPDPRLGQQAPLPQVTIVTPAGRTNVQRKGRAVVLADPLDPLSVVTRTDSFIVNGRVYTDFFEKNLRRLTTRTPAARQAQSISDTLGRVVQMTLPGLTTFVMTYDAGGRMLTKTQGTRNMSFGHDSLGRRIRNTDALGRSTFFSYNATGQLAGRTLPDGRVIALGYDQNGNVTTVTPPGRPSHRFVYDSSDRARAYIPPVVGSNGDTVSLGYNADGKLARIAGPDGDTTRFAFDTTGRRQSVTQPDGVWSYAYDASGYLSQTSAPGATKTYTYDGMLMTSVTASGSAVGTVSYSYDNDFRVNQETVNGGFSASRQYDPDGLPTVVGALSLTRNPTHGLVTGTSVGAVTTAHQYNTFGETSDFRAQWNSDTLYHAVYARDAGGRITTLTETIGGQTSTFGFVYDTAGRLGTVNLNGQPALSFGYDGNGNRTSLTSSAGTVLGSYDAQDRIMSYGDAAYSFSRRGALAQKVVGSDTTRYHFDAFGNLRTVAMPDGSQIEYVVDAEGRRVATKVNGSVVAGYLYDDKARIIARLDGAGSVVARFVYASKSHVPDYMVKAGQTYRFISDHVGSVRLIVDVASGAIAQRIDYDPFGRVVANSNPGFQPFGFIGGLLDEVTGLTRRGQREYDGQTGRWLTRDPLLFEGGSSNLYCYGGDDPVNTLDIGGGMGLLTEQMVVMEIVAVVQMIRKIYKAIDDEVGGVLRDFARGEEIRMANEASQALSAGFDEWAADADVGGRSEDELALMMEAYQHQVFVAAQAGAIAAGKAYVGAIKVLFRSLKDHRKEQRQKCGAMAYFWGDGWDPAVDHSNYGRGRGNWNLDSRSQMNKLCSEWDAKP